MAGAAHGASLEIFNNPVRVNFGSGFVPVSNGAKLQIGDSAMALQGGRAQIVYDDGCTDPVDDGEVVLVEEDSPCVGASAWPIYTLPKAAVVAGFVMLSEDDGIDGPLDP